MPNSPSVNFEFKNENVLQTTPMLGVSCVLARTCLLYTSHQEELQLHLLIPILNFGDGMVKPMMVVL